MHISTKSWARALSGNNLSRSAKALAHNSALRALMRKCLGAAASASAAPARGLWVGGDNGGEAQENKAIGADADLSHE
jgi:hypothetical protein